MTAPLSVLADGMVKVTWLSTLASQTSPAIADLNAVGGVDLSCYLTADGLTTGTDEQAITDDRLCFTQTFEKPGRFSDSLEVMYVWQPQLPAAADNKAYATLVRGTMGFIVIRWGKLYSSTYIATDRVNVYPAQCGVQREQAPEANSVLKIAQKIWVTGPVQRNVAAV